MHRANSSLGVAGRADVSMIGEARATPAAGSASGEAIPAEPHLQPQPAESPPKVESGIGRYSFGRRLGSLWPASTPTPVPNSPPAKVASEEDGPAESRGGDATLRANDGEDDESEGTWEPETEDFSDGASLASDEYSTITRSLQQAGTRSDAADPQSWLRASVSYAIGGWGKAAEPRYQAVPPPPEDVEGTAVSRGPTRQLRRPVRLQNHHQVVSVEDLEGLVVWQDPVQTAKVFAAGLYLLICLRHLLNGVEIIQPFTVLALSAICYMLYNSVQSVLRQRKTPNQGMEAQGAEGMLQLRVEGVVAKVAAAITPVVSAAVSLTARRLSSHSSKGSRFWLGGCMWVVVTLGELGWVTQASLAIYLWAALFTAPMVYLTCHMALDALVDECFAFLLSVLQGGSRGALLGSTVLGVGVFVVTDARFFTRITLAVAASAAVLSWQARYAKKICNLEKEVTVERLSGSECVSGSD